MEYQEKVYFKTIKMSHIPIEMVLSSLATLGPFPNPAFSQFYQHYKSSFLANFLMPKKFKLHKL